MAGLDDEQHGWLEGGLAGAATTVGPNSQPTIVRVFAQRASEDGACVDFAIARADAQRMLDNLAQRPMTALNLVCPRTYRSLLFKGPCAPLDAPWPDAHLQQCLRRTEEALMDVGMPEGVMAGMLSYYSDRSMVGLRLRVEATFDQSPGPQAGTKL